MDRRIKVPARASHRAQSFFKPPLRAHQVVVMKCWRERRAEPCLDPTLNFAPIVTAVVFQAVIESSRQTNRSKALGKRVIGGEFAVRDNAIEIEDNGRRSERTHSTVTDFARLRGWSTSVPLMTATW